jgi:chromosome segregation ATPase
LGVTGFPVAPFHFDSEHIAWRWKRNAKGGHDMDKETYQKKLQAQLDQWKAEIDKLQAKSSEASADMQAKYQEQIKELREKRSEMEAEYDKIQAASAEAWKDFKTGADQAWENMSNAMKSAWSRFS